MARGGAIDARTSPEPDEVRRRAAQAAARERARQLDPERLPDVPEPLPTVRRRPRGVETSPAEEAPGLAASAWRQTGGTSAADCFPGGYTAALLRFLPGGELEVEQRFGPGEGLVAVWRVGCRWEEEGRVLLLGDDPARRPPEQALRSLRLAGAEIEPPSQGWPARLPAERPAPGVLVLGGKRYTATER